MRNTTLLKKFLDSRKASNLSAYSLEHYEWAIGKLNAYLGDDPITDESVEGFILSLYPILADTTVRQIAKAVSVYLRWGERRGYIKQIVTVPKVKVAQDFSDKFLTADDVRLAITEGCKSDRDKALVSLMVDSGLRRAELLALTWDDLDIEGGVIRVRNGKGRKERLAYFGENTRSFLKRYMRKVKNPLLVFPLTNSGLSACLTRIGQRAGLAITPHKLRHTSATLMLNAGVSLISIQSILGHASIETTRGYISWLNGQVEDEFKRHAPMDGIE